MRTVRRLLTLFAVLAAVAALGATTALAKGDDTVTVSGSSSGTSTNTNGCDPASPHSTLLLCTFSVQGKFSVEGIGAGTYSGMTAIDYAQYGTAGTENGHPCTPITGSITFKKSAGSTFTTTLAAGSKICETGGAGAPHTTHLILTITGGTGRFHGITGTILSNGVSTDDPTVAGLHHDSARLSGQVTLHEGDGDGHGSGDDHGDD